MALCEHCRAEIEGNAARLPGPWFDHDAQAVAGVRLAGTCWRILEILWRRRGKFVTRDSLMTLLYAAEPDDPPQDKILDVYICRLRDALAPAPYIIETQYTFGWRLLASADSVVGEIEDNVPIPPAIKFKPKKGDKFGLEAMQIGQSRVIANTPLQSLQQACRKAARYRSSQYMVGFDDQQNMRVWRVG